MTWAARYGRAQKYVSLTDHFVTATADRCGDFGPATGGVFCNHKRPAADRSNRKFDKCKIRDLLLAAFGFSGVVFFFPTNALGGRVR